MKTFLRIVLLFSFWSGANAEEPVQISGVYPQLRMWNEEGECGTGALVVWQGELWAITYAPHMPKGSTDKLYRISPTYEQSIFEGSVGGTPANRMIHPETNQLLIGPYLIDEKKNIRVLPPTEMVGRLTANARHLTEPESKVYYATMEEGLYEVDMETLEFRCFIRDGHVKDGGGVSSKLPGYHGKGMYMSQDRLVYANNGDRDPRVKVDPTTDSGALAEWFGDGDWQLVRRNQFTEVTGPGGIYGNEDPASDPIWTMGWDAKSVILGLLEEGDWHWFRLPKGSHSYDGAHGWNTEWPRIREIGEGETFLATMHGTFWNFPSTFSLGNRAGISPRSNYLKVIGDFCRWKDHIVMGCDDSAKAEFLNTRDFKAAHGAPKQSNSNLWFVKPEQLDQLGSAIGRGSVWLREDVAAGDVSDSFLFAGYDYRQLHLFHEGKTEAQFRIEIDRDGTGEWREMEEVTVPAGGAHSPVFPADVRGEWIRLVALNDAVSVTANFQYRNRDERTNAAHPIFEGISQTGENTKGEVVGVMRSLAYDRLGLVAAPDAESKEATFYELNETLKIVPGDDPGEVSRLVSDVRQPEGGYEVDTASIVFTEDGKRWRLPFHPDRVPAGADREGDDSSETGNASKLPKSLTTGARVSASSVHKSYDASFAVDGKENDEEARWISREEEKPWIEMDLGEAQTVRQFRVISGWKKDGAFAARNFDVQIREADEWKTVPGGAIRDNQKIDHFIDFAEPVVSRHWRIISQDEGYLRIYEIAAYAEPVERSSVIPSGFGPVRVCREVATERDLLNVQGTFYELPARNAQGLAKVRPIATHSLAIQDFCSHNGLLFFTGVNPSADNDRILRSEDGKAAVWAGVIDELWQLGKPRGKGGPWKNSPVEADVPSDPYLMTAYDKKTVSLTAESDASISLEVDIDGTGVWIPYRSFDLVGGEERQHEFPEGFSAYWVRTISDRNTNATVQFTYE